MSGGGDGAQFADAVKTAQAAEDLGFDTIWMGEGRLMGSIVPLMTMVLEHTDRLKVGTSVLPYRTRNVSLLAGTFKTFDEMAPGRAIMGLGAWWEPLASRVGLPNAKPLKAMREIITVSKRLLAGETVTFHGEFVHVTDIRFDSPHDDEGRVYDVPIYTGPVRFKMVELSGEIADGVALDFLVPPSYTVAAREALERGAAKAGRTLDDFGIAQLVSCAVDDLDPQQAIDECKFFLTQYIAQQPHITEFSGADPELVDQIQKLVPWPATASQVKEAMRLVSNEFTQSVCACGTTSDAIEKIREYVEVGVQEPILVPRGGRDLETATAIFEKGRLAGL
ncbi:LLM class flavin-dependent oxidoreductase [Aeromicrobium flavum]|uniref:LLM class flavin-dependent oxidoreductase n=1 Tax=Aeromicrobium flavum TaxID=416568 RepID=UPI0031D64E1C